MAVDDYAALASRLSIRLRSTSKSIGLGKQRVGATNPSGRPFSFDDEAG